MFAGGVAWVVLGFCEGTTFTPAGFEFGASLICSGGLTATTLLEAPFSAAPAVTDKRAEEAMAMTIFDGIFMGQIFVLGHQCAVFQDIFQAVGGTLASRKVNMSVEYNYHNFKAIRLSVVRFWNQR